MAEISLLRGHPGEVTQLPSLLATKFYLPLPTPTLVARPRLTQCINDGIYKKLTLICAPAGFGKTTLLSEWCAELGRQREHPIAVAWVLLNASDNDPQQFWHYVLVALQRLSPHFGKEALLWLQSPEPPSLDLIVTSLINSLVETTEEVVLLLDDYHVIESSLIHESLTFLLDHQPPQMHLILVSRSDPPLPLARWRGQGQLSELRTDDLRFTLEEVADFFHTKTNLNLMPEAVATLAQRTEGWIAGLQLAALSLKGRSENGPFIQTFAGSHRYILDYLSEEVVQRQPEPLQRFLLQTALLDRLCGPLCDAVTGEHHSQERLEQIERSNLFLVSLDDERRWYRYHHLFQEMLRHRLQRSLPEQIPELHRRAANWYEQQGLLPEAVGHALAVPDYVRVIRLMEQATTWMLYGERGTLQQWIEALPEKHLKGSPRLCIAFAVLLTAQARFEEVEAYLQMAEVSLLHTPEGERTTQMQQMLGEIDSLRADLACHRGDMSSAITLCHQALQRIPQEQAFLRGTISLTLGAFYMYSGEVAPAQHTLMEALEVNQEEFPRPSLLPAPVEQLSEREVEVLHHIATGQSNAEIAQALVVSIGTVKTHLQHIYGKLDVRTRTQALVRARELHLLSS